MSENEINYLEQMIPTLASGASRQAYMDSLSAGNSVLEVIGNVLYEVSADGSKKKIKDVPANVKVDIDKKVDLRCLYQD